jgi:alpha-tubulin suppressor-like RCC1 family protein
VSTTLAFTAITVGASHACGLTIDGGVYCWGSNARGQLGDGTTAARGTPVRVIFP